MILPYEYDHLVNDDDGDDDVNDVNANGLNLNDLIHSFNNH